MIRVICAILTIIPMCFSLKFTFLFLISFGIELAISGCCIQAGVYLISLYFMYYKSISDKYANFNKVIKVFTFTTILFSVLASTGYFYDTQKNADTKDYLKNTEYETDNAEKERIQKLYNAENERYLILLDESTKNSSEKDNIKKKLL